MFRYYTLLVSLLMTVCLPLAAKESNQDPFIYLLGTVKSAVTKSHLPEAYVIRYDKNGNPTDTIQSAQKRYRYSRITGQEVTERSQFYYPVERKDTTIYFDVECPGFLTKTVTYTLNKIGKKEDFREIPVIYLDRAPHKLGEVTVTASKIKFYNKGDTIVYNADAFQLAEGSMLDALISQLPGVELDNDGRITVNGKFVESLLLDGKKFFDGDNNLMLQNIAAYTVKNVQVYEGQTRQEKWIGDTTAVKHLTMDVRLKKEFSQGVIINAVGGYGTKDRYVGKLFASMFSPTTRLSLVGNANNLNDNRNPGKNDAWTPEMMPSGTREFRNAAFDYNYESPDEKHTASGYAKVEYNVDNQRRTTNRTNFFTGGDTYDYSFYHGRDSRLTAETRNSYNYYGKQWGFWNMMLGRYIRRTNDSNSLSASFDKEQTDVTLRALETLYTEVETDRLEAVINRSITRTDGSSHEYEVQYFPDLNYKIPNTPGRIRAQLGVRYKSNKEERWRDYNINYGADPDPAVQRRQFFDNSPNNRLTLEGSTIFETRIGKAGLGVGYSYRFVNENKDSYMYSLERLEDMGIYGKLPSGYLDAFDPDNSYTSRLMENKHDLFMRFSWGKTFKNNDWIYVAFNPEVSLLHQHLNYWRGGRDYLVKGSTFLAKLNRYDFSVYYYIGAQESNSKRAVHTHSLQFNCSLDTKTPDPTHKIDIINDSDPLNIALGNPDLKNAYIFNPSLSWTFRPEKLHLINTVSLNANFTDNALVRGYTYEKATGIRRTRTYNVQGNMSQSANNTFSLQFGRKEQFSLSSRTGFNRSRYANMIGMDVPEPEKSVVNNIHLSQELKLDWTIGKQSIGIKGNIGHRHTTSTREDFNVIDANNYAAGIVGGFTLPAGFGIFTDLTLYARRGYGAKELDTTDWIWNTRLSYTPPRHKRLSLYLDAFDMLHQLSNVSYSVNDQGRTVTFSNALPRYVLFTAQYRLNINPKKR